ncbi:MAG: hypothetical protein EZS28_009728 [Streblomastix strix]|uniref:Uncharacterized protein n=1 Tax=Streblomastix strix TaxID=222440 RepID=A0A5J4WK84_9EUKA|nr:MAG: hypothetical protein EZS28_009728 [Streblomastix strix]
MFEIQQDYEAKKAAIISGAIKAILHIFETRQLDCINHYCSQAFYVFTIKNSSEIDRMIVGMKPFPGLIRLLSHTNTQVLSNAISSINNIVLSGTLTTMPNIPHPHYDSIAAVDGKNQLFNFFKRNNISKLSKNQASMVIWRIFRQREMTNIEQLQYLVAYLKNSLYEDDDWIKQTSKEGLQNLAQNAKNRSEITKGGFIIPK